MRYNEVPRLLDGPWVVFLLTRLLLSLFRLQVHHDETLRLFFDIFGSSIALGHHHFGLLLAVRIFISNSCFLDFSWTKIFLVSYVNVIVVILDGVGEVWLILSCLNWLWLTWSCLNQLLICLILIFILIGMILQHEVVCHFPGLIIGQFQRLFQLAHAVGSGVAARDDITVVKLGRAVGNSSRDARALRSFEVALRVALFRR